MYDYKELLLEIITAPFTDLQLYSEIKNILNLDKDTDVNKKEQDYQRYFREILNLLNEKQTIYSFDEVKLMIEKFYKSKCSEIETYGAELYLIRHIRKLADTLLTYRDGDICIKYWKSESTSENDFFGPYEGINKIMMWNSLNRIMTTDTLVCAYLADKYKLEYRNDSLVESVWENEVFRNEHSLHNYGKGLEILNGFYNQVKLEDIQLSEVLKKGLSETHIHMSAGGNVYIQWGNLMNAKNFYKNSRKNLFSEIEKFEKNNIVKFHSIRNLKKYRNSWNFLILEAAILRLILVLWFKYKNKFNFEMDNIITYLDQKLSFSQENLVLETDSIRNILNENFGNFDNEEVARDKLYVIYEFLYNEIEMDCKEEDINRAIRNTLNDSKLSIEQLNTTEENIILFSVFREIFQIRDDISAEFQRNLIPIFLKYINIKNMFFRLHVQSNKIKGLEYFRDYFKTSTSTAINIKDEAKDIVKYEKYNIILRNQLQDKNLKKLELRIATFGGHNSIENIKKNLLEDIYSILSVYKDILGEQKTEDICLLGIVVHFIKQEDLSEKKCWIEYGKKNQTNDINQYSTDKYLSYQMQRRNYSKQLVALRSLLFEYEMLSDFIVGIDAASDENSAEPWVFAPIYKYARDVKTYLKYGKKYKTNHLGFTFHVGEDFRHLITGLRRIDEVIEHFKYHSGDRIGHGIALGIDVEAWVRKHPVVILPRIEYLENLLWIWGIQKYNKQFSGIDGFLERKIMELASNIYTTMEGINVYELWEAYCKKFEDISIPEDFLSSKDGNCCEQNKGENSTLQSSYTRRLFCCETDEKNAYVWNSQKLYLTYHCENYAKKMREPISVDTSELSLDTVKDIQNLVAMKLSKNGIVVETNPTSNRTIGEVEDIFNHYILNLKSINRNDKSKEKSYSDIMVTINTDDPSVFHTGLGNEFAYIYYSLVNQGYSKHDVLNWIDEVRENGISASFIKQRSRNEVFKQLEVLLKEIKKSLN